MSPKRGMRIQSRSTKRLATVNKVWPDGSVTLRFGPAVYKDYSAADFERLWYVK